MIVTDTARFSADDADALVSASFACPYCLSLPAEVVLNLEDAFGSAALCRCDHCGSGWAITLTFGQSLRMALAPPDDLELKAA